MNLHSKVLVVDDVLVRIGSSNASNRSMGVDAECDLAVESGGEERIERAIAGFRNGLLAEHLGVSAGEVAEAIAATGSLVRAVEALQGRARTLRRLTEEPNGLLRELAPDTEIFDPERPLDGARLVLGAVAWRRRRSRQSPR